MSGPESPGVSPLVSTVTQPTPRLSPYLDLSSVSGITDREPRLTLRVLCLPFLTPPP